MNYQAFTNDSLTMMYEGIRGALASDDALSGLGEEPRFRVRETPEWKKHAADLESEMLRAECSSRSSIGRKISRRCPSNPEHAAGARSAPGLQEGGARSGQPAVHRLHQQHFFGE
jgi:hypothetical protein